MIFSPPALAATQYLIIVVAVAGFVGIVAVFRKLSSKAAVLSAIAALCSIEFLHRFRPSFHHPQNPTDRWVMLLAVLLLQVMLFGFVWPLCSLGNGICNAKQRSSYLRGAMVSDLAWLTVGVLAICLSVYFGWWLS